MIYVVGVNTTDRSPMAGMLLRELANAGMGQTQYVEEPQELAFKDDGYVLTLGAPALQKVTGQGSISENRGKMHSCIYNKDLLVFATYSPGFIYHHKENLPLFRDDLKLFKTVIKLDRDGILV